MVGTGGIGYQALNLGNLRSFSTGIRPRNVAQGTLRQQPWVGERLADNLLPEQPNQTQHAVIYIGYLVLHVAKHGRGAQRLNDLEGEVF